MTLACRTLRGDEGYSVPSVVHICRFHSNRFLDKKIKESYPGQPEVHGVLIQWARGFVHAKVSLAIVLYEPMYNVSFSYDSIVLHRICTASAEGLETQLSFAVLDTLMGELGT